MAWAKLIPEASITAQDIAIPQRAAWRDKAACAAARAIQRLDRLGDELRNVARQEEALGRSRNGAWHFNVSFITSSIDENSRGPLQNRFKRLDKGRRGMALDDTVVKRR